MHAAPTRPSRQEREWRRRHRDILDAATRLFLDLGFNGTTMQMIAEEAEYSVGYLYKHFPGKEHLLLEIIGDQLEILEGIRRDNRTRFKGRPLRVLKENVRQIALQLHGKAPLVSLFLAPGPSRLRIVRERLDRYRAEDAQLMDEAVALGLLAPCDSGLAAAVYNGVIWGLIRLLIETDRFDRLAEIPGIVETLVLVPLAAGCSDTNEKEVDAR